MTLNAVSHFGGGVAHSVEALG